MSHSYNWYRSTYYSPTTFQLIILFLKGERSKDITYTAFWRLYDVHEQCNESNFAEKSIPRYTSEWSRYCHFEFTKPEHIKPHQRVVLLMKVRNMQNIVTYTVTMHSTIKN